MTDKPSDGWIEWGGGRCPASDWSEMGNIQFRKYGRDHPNSEAKRVLVACSGWNWHEGSVFDHDIIAYRIAKP